MVSSFGSSPPRHGGIAFDDVPIRAMRKHPEFDEQGGTHAEEGDEERGLNRALEYAFPAGGEPPTVQKRQMSIATRRRLEEKSRRMGGTTIAEIEGTRGDRGHDAASRSTPSLAEETMDGGSSRASPSRETPVGPRTVKKVARTIRKSDTAPPPAPPESPQKSSKSIDQEFRKAFQDLRASGDWDVKVEALEKLHAILPDCTVPALANLHELSLAVVGMVQNLRSTVSKLAIVCLQVMYAQLGKAMDADLDATVGCLLKKIGEGNGFIVEAAERALMTMAANVSPTRAVASLVVAAENRNAAVRTMVATLLCKVIVGMPDAIAIRYVQIHGDAERLLPVVGMRLRDGLAEPRNAAKQILFCLSKFPEFDRTIEKVLTVQQAKEVRDALKNYQPKAGAGVSLPSSPQSNDAPDRMASPAPTPLSRVKSISGSNRLLASSKANPPKGKELRDPETLSAIYADLKADGFKKRYDALSSIIAFVRQYPQEMAERTQLAKLIDNYMERCRDGNSKIALAAIQLLQELLPLVKSGLESVINLIMPVLTNQLAASSPQIRAATIEAIDALMDNVDNALMLQNMASIVQFGANPRVKPLLAEKLACESGEGIRGRTVSVVTSVYPSKPSIVIKYALPASLKLLGDNKGDTKNSNAKLVQTLYALMGQELFFENAGKISADNQRRLSEILGQQL
ncbi:armadillo-type protein [Blyttiomyces helicus]|uniref:Armadillo-type protein n=1 Tax=Blyttiomyces helicus TaxID=388810 RepID=A0A4P9WEX7_9FUNG|nr:armadillo-type protein [Blyttiomyces helicus]|eukprot:RKO88966.1 armadillo-type protein [Blyttiomyces helicus]